MLQNCPVKLSVAEADVSVSRMAKTEKAAEIRPKPPKEPIGLKKIAAYLVNSKDIEGPRLRNRILSLF